MGRLFKAFLYKMSKDIAFRVILIIGVGLALLMCGLYFLIDLGLGSEELGGSATKFLTGPNMLLSSFSPVDNFGLAIPINLITFVCLEFSQGSIRNKIISGHSKWKIYTSLFVSGLVLTFVLLFAYMGLCTLLGAIAGGFDLSKPIVSMTSISTMLLGRTLVDAGYIWITLLLVALVYTSIVAFTIFFAALFRTVGPCIPVVIIVLMMLSVGGSLISIVAELLENDFLIWTVKIFNPLYAISGGASYDLVIDEETGATNMLAYYPTDVLVCGIVNNLVYSALFFFGGAFIFSKRDIK